MCIHFLINASLCKSDFSLLFQKIDCNWWYWLWNFCVLYFGFWLQLRSSLVQNEYCYKCYIYIIKNVLSLSPSQYISCDQASISDLIAEHMENRQKMERELKNWCTIIINNVLQKWGFKLHKHSKIFCIISHSVREACSDYESLTSFSSGMDFPDRNDLMSVRTCFGLCRGTSWPVALTVMNVNPSIFFCPSSYLAIVMPSTPRLNCRKLQSIYVVTGRGHWNHSICVTTVEAWNRY